MSSTIDDIIRSQYRDGRHRLRTHEQRDRQQRITRRLKNAPAVNARAFELSYVERIVIDQRALVSELVDMAPPQTPIARDVRVYWNLSPTNVPETVSDVVLCHEYPTQEDLLSIVAAYAARQIPARQVVVAGDLRAMPMPTYAALARAGVFLKHVRYATMPETERRNRIEEELRLVYRGLLGLKAAKPAPPSRVFDYESAPPRLTEEQLAALIEHVKKS